MAIVAAAESCPQVSSAQAEGREVARQATGCIQGGSGIHSREVGVVVVSPVE